MSTYTTTQSDTFTLLHAKQLASRVSADMKRCQQVYGYPPDDLINRYATELAHLLNGNYVEEYEFGYERGGQKVLAFLYRVQNGDLAAANDRPGGIPLDVNITDATPFNFLTPNSKWNNLPQTERDKIRAELPIKRTFGTAPAVGLGYWVEDKTYSAAGTLLVRKTFKLYGT